jgi:hypothetical protein
VRRDLEVDGLQALADAGQVTARDAGVVRTQLALVGRFKWKVLRMGHLDTSIEIRDNLRTRQVSSIYLAMTGTLPLSLGKRVLIQVLENHSRWAMLLRL